MWGSFPFDYAQGTLFDYAQGTLFDYAQGTLFDYAQGTLLLAKSTRPVYGALSRKEQSDVK